MSKVLPRYTEFETKYRISESSLKTFKTLMNSIEYRQFLYVEGKDFYFTKSSDEFIRLRIPNDKREGCELTIKKKSLQANNIERFEVNMRLALNEEDAAFTFVQSAGYDYNFSIWKGCHIYFLEDVVLSFYSVESDNKQWDTFFEIEVSPEITEEAKAWEVIKKYETMFCELGINAQKRLRKSLFEMYRKTEGKIDANQKDS